MKATPWMNSDAPRPQFVAPAKQRSEKSGVVNVASKFAKSMLKSEIARTDAKLLEDFTSVIEGGCIYLSHFFCEADDFSLLEGLSADLAANQDEGMMNWSKHLKHENPDFSPTFQGLLQRMADHFDVEVYATRLNFYRDGSDWKPFHHDSHAYGGHEQREDFTMGASFGAERELVFKHEASGATFGFPQRNGDIFAFDTEVNKRFKHGVPRARTTQVGPRFSIIAWGRRRTLNERNSGAHAAPQADASRRSGEAHRSDLSHDTAADRATSTSANASRADHQSNENKPPGISNEVVLGASEVASMVQKLVVGHKEGGRASRKGDHSKQPSRSTARTVPAQDNQRAGLEPAAGRGHAPATSDAPEPSSGAPKKGLVKALKKALGEQYSAFRQLSHGYQHGQIDVADYCAQASAMLGGDVDLMLDAASCLPDAMKRDAILKYHNR